ncbi:hypothetical protein [Paenibacillus sp.]|uniref:hypothetical protein n=1 Tax=Paenibacillus sp. TaxID=58172 RepID=UPI002838D03A|nr:hypothetical protein [Paenibacillus sp.]MDR0269630.1 hypothetical protein [Paenibacillus sp.]
MHVSTEIALARNMDELERKLGKDIIKQIDDHIYKSFESELILNDLDASSSVTNFSVMVNHEYLVYIHISTFPNINLSEDHWNTVVQFSSIRRNNDKAIKLLSIMINPWSEIAPFDIKEIDDVIFVIVGKKDLSTFPITDYLEKFVF